MSHHLISYRDRLHTTTPLILASRSPRRQQILRDQLGIPFSVQIPVDFDEAQYAATLDRTDPVSYTRQLACAKALALSDTDALVLGSDTIVVAAGDRILETPRDADDATRMLRLLRGTTHHVHSGVAIVRQNQVVTSFTDTTRVTFGMIDDAAIAAYVQTGEPMDKAGGYGIQGLAGQFVERIEGDYYTVMGLPLYRTSRALAAILREDRA